MMASMDVDAEAEMENLFAQDEAEEAPGTQSLTQEEGRPIFFIILSKLFNITSI